MYISLFQAGYIYPSYFNLHEKIIDVIPEVSYRGYISLDRFPIRLVPARSKLGNFGNDVF